MDKREDLENKLERLEDKLEDLEKEQNRLNRYFVKLCIQKYEIKKEIKKLDGCYYNDDAIWDSDL